MLIELAPDDPITEQAEEMALSSFLAERTVGRQREDRKD
jgi:hypothetical protein